MARLIDPQIRIDFERKVRDLKEGYKELGMGYPGKELDVFFGVKMNHASLKNTWNLRNISEGNYRKLESFFESRKSISVI